MDSKRTDQGGSSVNVIERDRFRFSLSAIFLLVGVISSFMGTQAETPGHRAKLRS